MYGPSKRLIYECELILSSGLDDWELIIATLENALHKEAEFQGWCPDWTYTLSPTEDEGVREVKVYGEFEEND